MIYGNDAVQLTGSSGISVVKPSTPPSSVMTSSPGVLAGKVISLVSPPGTVTTLETSGTIVVTPCLPPSSSRTETVGSSVTIFAIGETTLVAPAGTATMVLGRVTVVPTGPATTVSTLAGGGDAGIVTTLVELGGTVIVRTETGVEVGVEDVTNGVYVIVVMDPSGGSVIVVTESGGMVILLR